MKTKISLENITVFLQSLVLALAPLYIIRFHFPFLGVSIPTTLLEILLLFTFLATLLFFIQSKGKLSDLKTHFDTYILFFLLSAVLSAFITPNLFGGLGILKAYFIEPVIFYYCLVYTASKRGKAYITTSLLLSGVWICAISLLQKATGGFTLAPYELSQGRVSALYNSANSLALYLGPLIILAVACFVKEKDSKRKLIYFLVVLLFLMVQIFTRSRGGLIALLGALGVMMYSYFSLKAHILKQYWYSLPLVVLIILGIFFYDVYKNYNFVPYMSRSYSEGDTLQIRFFIWTGTINLLKDRPIFGAGLDGFKTVYSNQYRLPQYQEQFQYPHNLLLTFWAETGIYGLTSFLIILVSGFGLLIRNLSKVLKNENLLLTGIALISVLSYWVFHGVVDVPYFKNDLSVEFWTFFALIEIWQRSIKKQSM